MKETTICNYVVTGTPKAQPRPRAYNFHGRTRMYNPDSADIWKAQVMMAHKEAGVPLLVGPVSIHLTFYLKRTKTGAASKCAFPTCKPDLDNLVKSTMDALTDIGAWQDDAAVVGLHAWKLWAEDGQEMATVRICTPREDEP
jgi:Holliday junction resolvase RusA-like endonuclease